MNRLKSIALTTLGLIAALAAFGFFASVGLAVIGLFVSVGAALALAAGIASLFAKRRADDATATTAA